MTQSLAQSAIAAALLVSLAPSPAAANPFFFSTGGPDGKIATASRPAGAGKTEIETGDDFILGSPTAIGSATFTGLLTGGATIADIGQVVVEIYRIFPKDSTNPPSGSVPTRTNSPSDVEFADRDSAAGGLTFSASLISPSFTAANSVLNGINKIPNQTTGGEGPVTGQEVEFDVNFTTPFTLPEDHYFFVPQVEVTDPSGEFMWLSAPKPITGGSGPFTPDLQSWIRNEGLAPDWLRVGTDIIGGSPAPTFNAALSLTGATVPEPAGLAVLGVALAGLAVARRRRA